MNKKALTLAALLTALCLVCAACGGSAPAAAPEAPAAENEAIAVEPTAEPTAEPVAEPEAAPAVEPEPVPEEPAAEATWVSGTYTASSFGFGGPITVELTLAEDGSIAALTVDAYSETPGLGLQAAPELAEKIVAEQSLDVDGMTGATTSCTALKKAIEDALTQANALELYR